MKKLFNIKDKELSYEIKYFLDNPKFKYDFDHQNDNNSNIHYINENFIDILLLSFRNKLILNLTIKPLKEIQNEITFAKRSKLISWLTEINLKYIKDQNILFMAINLLDRILYKKNINIQDFQLIGILCFNLVLKMENIKSLTIEEEISLIGRGDENLREKKLLRKKIKNTENIILDLINFELRNSTSILILIRLIQIMNIQNIEIEKIFFYISNFLLEISLYDERFYELNDFEKALSSLIIAKEILNKYNYKIGLHNFLINCCKLKSKKIKYYLNLCLSTINHLKQYKYGTIFFIKYQEDDFLNVYNIYLNDFINNKENLFSNF